jgi:hypothetical protein
MKIKIALPLLAAMALAACGNPHTTEEKAPYAPVASKAVGGKTGVRLTLLPQGPLVQGKPVNVLLKLNDLQDQHVIADDELKVVHTEKLHVLLIDSSFTDYQHIHPKPTGATGVYSFDFTPHKPGGYRVWADVTPVETDKQMFVRADLGAPRPDGVSKVEQVYSTIGNYHFSLSFDQAPQVGGESKGTIHVTEGKADKPVASLEPVMGAYSHIVAFSDDFRSVIHTHPLGDEPSKPTDRGGPDIVFHFAPDKAGFVKLFAQVKIGGKEYFAPFGVNVKPRS